MKSFREVREDVDFVNRIIACAITEYEKHASLLGCVLKNQNNIFTGG